MRDRKITRIEDYDDLYFMIFYPAAIGKSDTWVFPDQIYAQNRGIDMNKNGQITVAEFPDVLIYPPVYIFLKKTNKQHYMIVKYPIQYE